MVLVVLILLLALYWYSWWIYTWSDGELHTREFTKRACWL